MRPGQAEPRAIAGAKRRVGPLEKIVRTLLFLCLELIALSILSGLVILVAAFRYFDGFVRVNANEAFIFTAVSLTVAAIALIAYAVVRVGRLKLRNSRLQQAAMRDGLTRLYNRTAFKAEAERMIASIGRRKSDPAELTLLVIDADHFKRINDRLGHTAGDKALVSIAAALAGGVRHDDLVGRLGGEEFVVLLKDAGPQEAMIVAERLRLMVNRLMIGPAATPVRLSVSIGGVSFHRPIPFELAYRQADKNLYNAKRTGRNRSDISDLLRGPAGSQGAGRAESWRGQPDPRASGRTLPA